MDDLNPYRSPIVDGASQAPLGAVPAKVLEPEASGWIGPLLLAWIGVLLAVGIIGTVTALLFVSFDLPLGGGVLALLALLTPPARLVWVIFVAFQRRRYGQYWLPGERAFLAVMWVLNVVLLCLDAAVILLIATCISMLT
ncbi:MAG: hypothetical protein ACO1RT_10405 [Planctomycetaceae bacterium]